VECTVDAKKHPLGDTWLAQNGVEVHPINEWAVFDYPGDEDITREMVMAGIAEFRDWQVSEDWREGNLVKRIFLAMRNHAAPYQPGGQGKPSFRSDG
jgi:hypothetical protein